MRSYDNDKMNYDESGLYDYEKKEIKLGEFMDKSRRKHYISGKIITKALYFLALAAFLFMGFQILFLQSEIISIHKLLSIALAAFIAYSLCLILFPSSPDKKTDWKKALPRIIIHLIFIIIAFLMVKDDILI